LQEKSLEEQVAEKLGKKQEVDSIHDDTGTTKYLIRAKLEANGMVERPDVVGAIFGQTEGLLGGELDLRELLKTGRIGRIKVDLNSVQGKTSGNITIPSSLDRVETAIIAAALETIERIGPCESGIKIEDIQDVRDTKRKFIMDRAKEILRKFEETSFETQEITDRVKETIRVEDISNYEGLPAGPAIKDSDAIIIVEGRADVLNLLRAGVKNTIAVEGTSVPKPVVELVKNKTVTAFLDNDRGGDLIMKELQQVANIHYVARPPPGQSVEDLTRKDIIKALRNKAPFDRAMSERREEPAPKPQKNDEFVVLEENMKKLHGSLKAVLLDENSQTIAEVPVKELKVKLNESSNVVAVVFDGVVTQDLVDAAAARGVRYLVGAKSRAETTPKSLRVLTLSDFQRHHR
jgi:DNA primase